MKRPILNKDISIKDFRDFYWLKKELIEFCQKEGLNQQGGKIDITKRIEEFLLTGKKNLLRKRKSLKKTSSFDWNHASLKLETIITDNYKNSQHVRQFFESHLGKQFKFNVEFMNWMKNNVNKTLEDALMAWKEIEKQKKKNKKEIPPQFKYNQYIRDFLKDNPSQVREIAIQCWNIKKTRRGNPIYDKSDLFLLDLDDEIKSQ